MMFACACVGQRDDPEEPDDGPGTVDPSDVKGSCLVLDFTGTWCVNCPRMDAAIEEAMEKRPGLIVPVSVHCLSLDPMAVSPLCDNLIKRFGVSAYPSVVVDLSPGSLFSTTSSDLLLSKCDALLKERGASSEIECEYSVQGDVISVTVKAKTAVPGDYSLQFIVVEDGIVSPQTGGTQDHVHNNVLREWHESEPFPNAAAGQELTYTDTAAANGDFRVIALVCRGGVVDNVK